MGEEQEQILFLTGKLAEKRLHKILESMQPTDFSYQVENIGVNVAALMTAKMIKRRLTMMDTPDRVIVPGLCRGDLPAISEYFEVPFIHGPIDLKDMPVFFGQDCKVPDLSQHNVLIFAEIVDAPNITVEDIVTRARKYQRDGANIIDIGCLPDTPFPHLEESVEALHEAGFKVSVDSLEDNDLLRGGRAGADYLLSLSESTLWIADEVSSIPVLIPDKHGDMDSMYRVIEKFAEKGRPFFADCILDPIHFGFTESLVRYRDLRQQCPDIEIMMGIGNLTELTEADTTGINATLFGIISELGLNAILATEVSPHARAAVREADFARRMMYAAKQEGSLPKGLDGSLLTTHARNPFTYTADEIEELASEIKDPSYRVQVSESGVHVYNRDGIINARNPFELFPELDLLQDDAAHAFYMGVELARAQIAWQLGKRYMQDEELEWGVATEPDETSDSEEQSRAAHALKKGKQKGKSSTEYKVAGSTLQAKKKKTGKKKITKKKSKKKTSKKKITKKKTRKKIQ
jgi:dihydropteroate synthase